MKKYLFISTAAIFMCMIAGCSNPTTSSILPPELLSTLTNTLTDATFVPFGNISDVMETDGWFTYTSGKRISVYVYDSEPQAQSKLEQLNSGKIISAEGNIYTPNWNTTPHFYQNEHTIIAYYGNDLETCQFLENSFHA